MAAGPPSLTGLSSADAVARLARDGPNELAARARTLPAVLAAQLRSPLLGLLLVAAVVSVGVGERTDGAIILAILVGSVGLGVFNEIGKAAFFRGRQLRTFPQERSAPPRMPSSPRVRRLDAWRPSRKVGSSSSTS